jgi:hypothetical protein
LSLKRVEEGEQPVPRADGAESVHTMPDLKLSEEAFPAGGPAPETAEDLEEGAAEAASDEEMAPEAEAVELVTEADESAAPETEAVEPATDELTAEAEQPLAEAEVEAEVADDAPEPAAQADEAEQTET